MVMKPIRLDTSDKCAAHDMLIERGWKLEKKPVGLPPVVVACYSKGKIFAHLVKYGKYFELGQAARPRD